ncbi:YbaB/EbfC family nucleoid-associated protein [Ammonifex thiophilus]|uniref:Nucleoid-associated protein DXX99_00690 n=1 Tax=Ammonifex thiophilus TaxID=444093 RepID=A0A3D8P8L6_9THEO|nr:YbaB/EbfC family nucleoid-associated protein [Ammonifex thiophilus]RDV84905.1 YbaB/EbfC family nucleoid-associated protein [Ammonifex thiophilus]
MMRQVQKLQAELAKLQEELGNRTTEATAGGGMVRAVVNGRQELVSLEIKPEAVDPEEVELLQDMILAAVNEALRQAREMVAQEMGRLTGGLGIPGLF